MTTWIVVVGAFALGWSASPAPAPVAQDQPVVASVVVVTPVPQPAVVRHQAQPVSVPAASSPRTSPPPEPQYCTSYCGEPAGVICPKGTQWIDMTSLVCYPSGTVGKLVWPNPKYVAR